MSKVFSLFYYHYLSLFSTLSVFKIVSTKYIYSLRKKLTILKVNTQIFLREY